MPTHWKYHHRIPPHGKNRTHSLSKVVLIDDSRLRVFIFPSSYCHRVNLQRTIELINTLEKELALVNIDPSDPIDQQLAAYFETLNVRITTHQTATGLPADIAVLSSTDGVLELLDVDMLRELVEQKSVQSSDVGISDGAYEQVLGHLKETTFSSYDTEQMLYASREIEDRARRAGHGTVHAGFQRCSIIATQQPVYADLARQGVTVHAYGAPDTTPPDLADGRVHAIETDEIAASWFVVFDGGGDPSQKSALIAEERDDGSFYGGWTYDPKIVDSIVNHLEETYLSAGSLSRHSEL